MRLLVSLIATVAWAQTQPVETWTITVRHFDHAGAAMYDEVLTAGPKRNGIKRVWTRDSGEVFRHGNDATKSFMISDSLRLKSITYHAPGYRADTAGLSGMTDEACFRMLTSTGNRMEGEEILHGLKTYRASRVESGADQITSLWHAPALGCTVVARSVALVPGGKTLEHDDLISVSFETDETIFTDPPDYEDLKPSDFAVKNLLLGSGQPKPSEADQEVIRRPLRERDRAWEAGRKFAPVR
jgi:hypothetical protein